MKRLLISLVIAALVVVPQFALGSDSDEFKAEVERFIKAFNSLDANTISQTAHPGCVVFNTDSPFITVYPTPAAFGEGLQNWFSGLESLSIILVEPQYNVVGNTGVMWGYESSTAKPKDGPSTTIYYRTTMTFVQSGGKWRVLSIHMSKLPSGALN